MAPEMILPPLNFRLWILLKILYQNLLMMARTVVSVQRGLSPYPVQRKQMAQLLQSLL